MSHSSVALRSCSVGVLSPSPGAGASSCSRVELINDPGELSRAMTLSKLRTSLMRTIH